MRSSPPGPLSKGEGETNVGLRKGSPLLWRGAGGEELRAWLVVLVCLLTLPSLAQRVADKPAYRLFTGDGKPVKYAKMTTALAGADVVLFGEAHNNPIAHWLELQVAQDLLKAKGDKLVLAAEMFERDVQPVLAGYVAICDSITEKDLTERARPWPNYATDYRPLVELARAHHLRFIGTNTPRPLARQVAKDGPESLAALPEKEKSWLMPLPLIVDAQRPAYQKMRAMFGGDAGHGGGGAGLDKMIAAQALKDATMAHFIAAARGAGETVLHFNGSFHSDDHSGICEYLLQAAPGTRLLTISTVSQEDLGKLSAENRGKADYILVVPADMTTTY
ncbi:MAG: ChaN family lipoprotein [Hymenobacteraceae bacterium]|nr:ChaN family lipoprotein [Hymenobacteraceae bacterium]